MSSLLRKGRSEEVWLPAMEEGAFTGEMLRCPILGGDGFIWEAELWVSVPKIREIAEASSIFAGNLWLWDAIDGKLILSEGGRFTMGTALRGESSEEARAIASAEDCEKAIEARDWAKARACALAQMPLAQKLAAGWGMGSELKDEEGAWEEFIKDHEVWEGIEGAKKGAHAIKEGYLTGQMGAAFWREGMFWGKWRMWNGKNPGGRTVAPLILAAALGDCSIPGMEMRLSRFSETEKMWLRELAQVDGAGARGGSELFHGQAEELFKALREAEEISGAMEKGKSGIMKPKGI